MKLVLRTGRADDAEAGGAICGAAVFIEGNEFRR